MLGWVDDKNKAKMPSPNQVLIEHFDAKFDLLLDGYAATNKKIDDLINGLRNEMNERFDDVYARFDAIDDRFTAIDERFATIDDKFEAVFEVLDAIKQELKSVKI